MSDSHDAEQAAAERRQRAVQVQSGAARAAVLGINDGLVTNTALILGVVGATDAAGLVRLAGLASLVAGACSMAAGEYVSMRAQVELLQRLVEEERQAMAQDPARERAVIRGTLERSGFTPAIAERVSQDLAKDPERALGVYSRAVLGVNPDELGSPSTSALSSMVAFATGALIPLLPWFIAPRATAIAASLALSGLAAIGVGGTLGYLSNGRVVASALRQLLIVALASAVTFVIGELLSASSFRRAPSEPLVGVDQVLRARPHLAVDGDLLQIERARERHLLRVVAGEGGLDLRRHPLAQLLGRLEADLLEERREEPSPDAPRHAEGARERGRRPVEPAVDVDLLVHGGAVAAVLLRGAIGRDLHGGEDLARQRPAAGCVEADGGPGGHERLGEIVHEGGRARHADVGGADLLQDVRRLGLPHDVHQRHLVLEADLLEHLPEIGCRGGVDERLMPFRAHGFHHAERGEGIDEAACALRRGRPRRQHEALHGLDAPVLRVHRATEYRDGLAQQGLRGG